MVAHSDITVIFNIFIRYFLYLNFFRCAVLRGFFFLLVCHHHVFFYFWFIIFLFFALTWIFRTKQKQLRQSGSMSQWFKEFVQKSGPSTTDWLGEASSVACWLHSWSILWPNLAKHWGKNWRAVPFHISTLNHEVILGQKEHTETYR